MALDRVSRRAVSRHGCCMSIPPTSANASATISSATSPSSSRRRGGRRLAARDCRLVPLAEHDSRSTPASGGVYRIRSHGRIVDGLAAVRSAPRRSRARCARRLHGRNRRDAGARHRRQQRDLQPGERRAAAPGRLSRRRSADAVYEGHPRSEHPALWRLAGGLRRSDGSMQQSFSQIGAYRTRPVELSGAGEPRTQSP